VAIGQGDVVLIRTGWIETKLADPGFYDGEPGIDLEAGQWLAERGVAAIGADNFAIEAIPFPEGKVFPVHQCVLRGYGVALIEGLVLEPLAKSGASEFLFMASPLPIVGGTGSPLAPVAVL
jgi:kynurenine formamidase